MKIDKMEKIEILKSKVRDELNLEGMNLYTIGYSVDNKVEMHDLNLERETINELNDKDYKTIDRIFANPEEHILILNGTLYNERIRSRGNRRDQSGYMYAADPVLLNPKCLTGTATFEYLESDRDSFNSLDFKQDPLIPYARKILYSVKNNELKVVLKEFSDLDDEKENVVDPLDLGTITFKQLQDLTKSDKDWGEIRNKILMDIVRGKVRRKEWKQIL